MAIQCAAAEHNGVIKKEKKEEESSWVKLKAFPTNVGRPNYVKIENNGGYRRIGKQG